MLQNHGYYVQVCTYYQIDFYKSFLEENNIDNVVINEADNHIKRIYAVRNHFLEVKPDWVIAYQETPSLIACMAKILGCNFKLIVSERNTTQRLSIKERIRFSLYRFADFIVPNSFSQERFIKNYYPNLSPKVSTITNFVDLVKFHFAEHQRHFIPEILVAASIWPPKNTLGFICALKVLRDKGVRFHVSWYGKNEAHLSYINQCESKIIEFGLQDYISLLPKTDQINTKYQECDFFCLPSFYEGTPNVICEAIASGRPVICSDVCDNGIYVKDHFNGSLFNPYDVNSIAETISRIIDLSDLEYHNYCNNSRKIAEQLLSQENFIEKYIHLLLH